MRRFYYKAKDKEGRIVTGEVEATNDLTAARLVRSKDLIVISIRVKFENPLSFILKIKDRITSKDITTFTRQLSTMINAGLPITEALLVLRSQSKGVMQKMVSEAVSYTHLTLPTTPYV